MRSDKIRDRKVGVDSRFKELEDMTLDIKNGVVQLLLDEVRSRPAALTREAPANLK